MLIKKNSDKLQYFETEKTLKAFKRIFSEDMILLPEAAI